MIKLNNYGVTIMGNVVMNEAELTLLLSTFYRRTVESTDEEFALEKMREVAEIAISGETTPRFNDHIEIKVDESEATMLGCNGDIIKALGVIAGALYKTHIDNCGEDEAKQWLAFIGRLAVMSDEELNEGTKGLN